LLLAWSENQGAGAMRMSYAQNLEDYHLDLVFAGQDLGTYIDVGGGHPVADNVSFWFYLKGWQGLVVEPQQRLADIYAHVRPRDTTVACLAGREEGEAEFYAVEKLHGLSTTVREHAIHSRSFGVDFRTMRRPVRALKVLCKQAALKRVDFLKIDAEGAEADVLAGMDFDELRPRLLVIEAEVPGTMPQAWRAWEPSLLERRYRLAFIDSLNRWYVAEEASALCARFPKEPAAWHSIEHLWHCGRAPERPEHPDHTLAKVLQHGFLAMLPSLDRPLLHEMITRGLEGMKSPTSGAGLEELVGRAEFPRARAQADDLAKLLDTDELRAALGRIACAYDGGHIMD
jgi:FkbM family methyltransferase